ncbi:uncharacterized protein LOC133184653 [Saccostrea echinata]|uniref:uncharacterized protein LOC133184653 n=1 Tax=Saccostrea echinata TaxID=191078 RepID=UPI002A7FAA53|nr:uncharacterized protein LOC133184653 [Saccostrea echinata]
MKWWTFIFVLVIATSLTNARGGRGGSRGGRYGGGSYRGSRSYRSSFRGNRLSSSSSIRSALLLGTVYGASRYRMRASYRDHGTLPKVCYNDKYNMSANGTVSYKGRFFCPLDESMSDDYKYCCGEEGRQYCCIFWTAETIAGLVIGIIIGTGLLFVGVFCVVKRLKSTRLRRSAHTERRSNIYLSSSSSHENSSAYPPPSYEMATADEKSPPPPPPPYPTKNSEYTYTTEYGVTPSESK